MFATRNNIHNENAIYEQQTAAAGKPLNQGVKGLAPKTPGNRTAPKTPFKGAQHDENATFKGGKTGGKGRLGGAADDAKGVKLEKAAFVTPAGPRTVRAPLGNKTTNAKGAAFQTPGPPATQEKPSVRGTSPRLRRTKVKVHQAKADPLNNGLDEPEIEYMPPRGVPLPDYPTDCWPHDRTYPQFEGKNLTKGWWSEFQPQRDDNEDDESSFDFEGKMRALEEKEERLKQAQKAKKVSTAPTKAPSTLDSKGAASALASAPSARLPTKLPSFAAPTASAMARQPSALTSKKPSGLSIPARGNTRHTAAKVASNTTLGYAKGRAVSATARAPLADVHRRTPSVAAPPMKTSPVKLPFGGETTPDDLLGLDKLTLDEGEEDAGLTSHGAEPFGDLEEDNAYADFQLQPVEL